jgi:hypothetical protein
MYLVKDLCLPNSLKIYNTSQIFLRENATYFCLTNLETFTNVKYIGRFWESS